MEDTSVRYLEKLAYSGESIEETTERIKLKRKKLGKSLNRTRKNETKNSVGHR